MLHLVSKEIAKRKRHHQSFLPAIRMHDVVNHFHVVALCRAMKGRKVFCEHDSASTAHLIFRSLAFFQEFRIVHSPRVGLEEIENQVPTGFHMIPHALQTIQLLPCFQ